LSIMLDIFFYIIYGFDMWFNDVFV